MAQNEEFHGHEMQNPTHRLELLRMGQSAEMKVGALIVSKETRKLRGEALGHQSIALELLNQFLPQYVLKKLWCDDEFQSADAKSIFESELKRCHRAIHPNTRFDARVCKSYQSDLIQLADGVAYALQSQARGTLKNPDLRQLLKEIAADEGNLILRR